jgi:hypothetical protein
MKNQNKIIIIKITFIKSEYGFSKLGDFLVFLLFINYRNPKNPLKK